MPSANQSTRGGLITALVIFVILFIASVIAFFYVQAENTNLQEQIASKDQVYSDIVVDPAGAAVKSLQQLRQNRENGFLPVNGRPMPVLNVALEQTSRLSKLVTGNADTPAADAIAQANQAIAAAGKSTGVNLPLNLTDSITALASAYNKIESANKQLQANMKDLQAQTTAAIDAANKTKAEMQTQLAQVQADAEKKAADAAAAIAAKNTQFAGLEKEKETNRQAAVEATNKVAAQLGASQKEVQNLKKEVEGLQTRLAKGRPNTGNAVVQQADGRIIAASGSSLVTINRGAGNQISPGMTFEVYDANEGVPPPGDGMSQENLPAGKASIEVVRIGPTTSQCRVTRLAPGQMVVEGDLIANLVYDANTRYKFVVYGMFDLDNNGLATLQDAETVKRLITQWGGQVTDKVDVNSDFLVIGEEPKVPQDDPNDPIAHQKYLEAVNADNAYQAVVQKALDLHVPIMNQNRFLYYVGYYGQATR